MESEVVFKPKTQQGHGAQHGAGMACMRAPLSPAHCGDTHYHSSAGKQLGFPGRKEYPWPDTHQLGMLYLFRKLYTF